MIDDNEAEVQESRDKAEFYVTSITNSQGQYMQYQAIMVGETRVSNLPMCIRDTVRVYLNCFLTKVVTSNIRKCMQNPLKG